MSNFFKNYIKINKKKIKSINYLYNKIKKNFTQNIIQAPTSSFKRTFFSSILSYIKYYLGGSQTDGS